MQRDSEARGRNAEPDKRKRIHPGPLAIDSTSMIQIQNKPIRDQTKLKSESVRPIQLSSTVPYYTAIQNTRKLGTRVCTMKEDSAR